MQRFRGGLVFKTHRLLFHSTLGLRATKKQTLPEVIKGIRVEGSGVRVERLELRARVEGSNGGTTLNRRWEAPEVGVGADKGAHVRAAVIRCTKWPFQHQRGRFPKVAVSANVDVSAPAFANFYRRAHDTNSSCPLLPQSGRFSTSICPLLPLSALCEQHLQGHLAHKKPPPPLGPP